jgi:hypothetical protein
MPPKQAQQCLHKWHFAIPLARQMHFAFSLAFSPALSLTFSLAFSPAYTCLLTLVRI